MPTLVNTLSSQHFQIVAEKGLVLLTGHRRWHITLVFSQYNAVMTNFEEVIALVIFLPCLVCVLAGICSMGSYRCACCCCYSNNSENCYTISYPWYCQQDPRTDLHEAQQNYRRLTRDTSTVLNLSFDEEGSRVVTEFDFRQSLHMECGVLALEPPPSYAAAMKTVQVQSKGGQRAVSVRESNIDGPDPTSTPITRTLPKESPPPYHEETSSHAIHLNVLSAVVRTETRTQNVDVSSV